jgi:Carboxypeptidase regulatory-like domain/PDZ domain
MAIRPALTRLVAPEWTDTVSNADGQIRVTIRANSDADAADAHAGQMGLEGARVRAYAIRDDLAHLAGDRQTDKAGQVTLASLPRGATWILADAAGFARGSTYIVLGGEPRVVVITLEPEHVLFVEVTNEMAEPLDSAQVEVLAQGARVPVGARTAADGFAHVVGLPAGPWRVNARAPSYEEGEADVSSDLARMTITLRKLGSFAVHVVDEKAQAVPGAQVAVAGATLWPPRAAQTDAQGDVRIGGLATGVYALRASRDNLVSPIELGVGLDRGEEKAVLLQVGPGRWVGVHVTDGDAEEAHGVAAARVTLAEGGLSPFPLEATTDTKGKARLGPFVPGAVTLTARAAGFVARAVSLADPPPAETRIFLLRAGVLQGRVVDARGYPVEGATIEVAGTDLNGAPILDDPRRASFQEAQFDAMLGGPAPLVPAGELGLMPGPVPPVPRSAGFLARPRGLAAPDAKPWVTRADGTFRAAPASPGRVRAIAHHPQYVDAQSDLVTLAPGGETDVEVVMRGGGALEGRVVDSTDRPVEGARISASAARGGLERAIRTASDGTFAFAGLPEAVSLTVSTDRDDQPDVRMSIAIAEGERKDVTVRMPQPRGGLAVNVIDDREFPISLAQVSASSLSADLPLRTTAFTDPHGDALLRRARGIPLRVEVSARGHAPRVITLEGSREPLRIVLALAEGATGDVVDARTGDPVVGAEVALYTDLGVRRVRTDARGTFGLSELAPGAARMRVRASGFATVLRSVVIPGSGGRRPFAMPRVELLAEALVEGDVVDAHGDPVPGARVAKDHAPTWLLVGTGAEGTAVTDARGRFSLGELPEGTITLEAYAPEIGRARVDGVQVVAGRTKSNVRIVLAGGSPSGERANGSAASGNIAVTLGETGAVPPEVVVLSVAAGSEAERRGLAPGDVIVTVDGMQVRTIEEARERLGGPMSDDVVVKVRRGDREMALSIAREEVRR